jgi:hypothetical protein
MPAALLDMAGVAAFRGVHYDTARKGWRSWVREGFPAPVTAAAPWRWNPASLDAWAVRQEAQTRTAVLRALEASDPDVAANQNEPDAPPSRPTARRIDRERNAVLALMQGA